jgi:CheY-like chemotaxis protein
LLVEDLDLNREMVGMLLSPFGCELSEATNGVEAVNAIEAEPYDAILMDLQLPEMDGFEAIRRIRAREDERARTPILAVSGRVMAADIAQARAAGADGHLSKPYTSQDLVAAILKCRRDAGTED